MKNFCVLFIVENDPVSHNSNFLAKLKEDITGAYSHWLYYHINVQHVDRLQLIINLQFTHDLNWTAGLMEGLRGGAQVCARLTGTWCFAGWRRRVWCRFLPRSEWRVRRQRSAVSESRTARLRNTVTWQTFNKKLRLKRAIPDKLRLCQLKVNGFTHSVRGVPQGSTLGPM